ncbi:ABATE domain-containing protein, partial [Jiangella rhizosphaerae]
MPVDASTLPLVGGHVALDLVNTVEPRLAAPSAGQARDHLTGPEALLTWAGRVNLVDAGENAAVRAAWAADPGAAGAALAAVEEIREALHTVLLAALDLIPGDAPPVRAAADHLHTRRIAALGRSALRLR